jgi:pimeloyl-ACP methyl ester carboxylesterase
MYGRVDSRKGIVMAEATVTAKPDTIVMIHGLWMTPRSWEHWKERYEARGYTVHAPAWPGFEGEVEALNADPSPMKDLKAETVIDAYEAFINELDGDPIIMGHSLGGAITQVLLNRGLGSVGVGLSAATVKGIRDLPWSTLRAAGPALNPFKRGNPVPITEKEFHYAFANTMSEEESKPIYQRYAVPAASDVLADIALANLHRNPPTEVDFAKHGRIPLLFIGLSEDHVVPPKATMHNERKYDDSVSITEYHEFEGRPHFPGAPGWEEVADFAIDWAERHAGLTVAEHAAAKDSLSGG